MTFKCKVCGREIDRADAWAVAGFGLTKTEAPLCGFCYEWALAIFRRFALR